VSTEIFKKREAEYLSWLNDFSEGFVVNTPSHMPPNDMMLHRASCKHIRQYQGLADEGGFTERAYIKICDKSLLSIQAWAHKQHAELKRCSFCAKDISFDVLTPDVIDDINQDGNSYEGLDETERVAIVKSRIGQGLFRKRLIDMWGACAVTGLGHLTLLRASHIKPWRNSSNHERLDPMNGLLLEPTLDQLFDCGLMTFSPEGVAQFSGKLLPNDRKILRISGVMQLRKVPEQMEMFMKFHREYVFEQG